MLQPLLCNTRSEDPDRSLISRDRDNCMNVRILTTAIGTYKVCPACNKWETEKNWDKGQEKDGWTKPYSLVRRIVMFVSFGVTLGLLITAAHLFS